MRLIHRILVVAGGLLGAILALTWMAYLILVSPIGMGWIAGKLEGTAAENGISLSIGTLGFGLWDGISAQDLKLKTEDNRFELKAGSVSIIPRLSELFHGGRGVESVTVERVVAVVHRDTLAAPVSGQHSPFNITQLVHFFPDRFEVLKSGVRVGGHGVDFDSLLVVRQASIDDSVLTVSLSAVGWTDVALVDSIPLLARSEIRMRGAEILVDTVTVTLGSVHLVGSGRTASPSQGPFDLGIQVRADLSDLPTQLTESDLSGVAHLSAEFFGVPGRWDGGATLHAPRLSTPWLDADTVSAKVTATPGGGMAIVVSGRLIGADVRVRAESNSTGGYSLTATIDTLNLGRIKEIRGLPIGVRRTPLLGRFAVDANVSGPSADSIASGELAVTFDSLVVGRRVYGDAWVNAQVEDRMLNAKAHALHADVSLEGVFSLVRPLDLAVEATVAALDSILGVWGVRFVTGSTNLKGRLTGPFRHPGFSLFGPFQSVNIGSVSMGEGRLTVSREAGHGMLARLISADGALEVDGRFYPDWKGLDSSVVSVSNATIERLVGKRIRSTGLSGDISGVAAGSGKWRELVVSAEAATRSLMWNHHSFGGFAAKAVLANRRISANALGGDHALIVDFDLGLDSGANSSAKATWVKLDFGKTLSALLERTLTKISGTTDGDLSIVWGPDVVTGVSGAGRLSDATVSMGLSTFNLARPAAVVFTAGGVGITEPLELSSGDQRVVAVGEYHRERPLDFLLSADRLNVGQLANIAGYDTDLKGVLSARFHVKGTARNPRLDSAYFGARTLSLGLTSIDTISVLVSASGRGPDIQIDRGRVAMRGLSIGKLTVDAASASLRAGNDTLWVDSIQSGLARGSLSGSAMATFNLLSLPTSRLTSPRFEMRMNADSAEISVPWDSRLGRLRRGGAIVDGHLWVDGRSWKSSQLSAKIAVDTFAVISPAGRSSIHTSHPMTIEHTERSGWAARSGAQLIMMDMGDTAGVLIVESGDTGRISAFGSKIDLAVAETFWPIVRLGETDIVDEGRIAGTLNARLSFAANAQGFAGQLRSVASDARYKDFTADSLVVSASIGERMVSIHEATAWHNGSALRLTGTVPYDREGSADLILRGRNHPIGPFVVGLLPELVTETYTEKTPWSEVTPSWSGRVGLSRKRFLSSAARGRTPEALPTDEPSPSRAVEGVATLNLRLRGQVDSLSVDGGVRVTGAVLQMINLENPARIDTTEIRFTDNRLLLSPTRIVVRDGPARSLDEDQITVGGSYDLNSGHFDWEAKFDRPQLGVVRVADLELPGYLFFLETLRPVIQRLRRENIARVVPEGALSWSGDFRRSLLSGSLSLSQSRLEQDITVLDLLGPSSRLGLGDWVAGITLDVGVTTSGTAEIDNNLADLEAQGDLRFGGAVLDPSMVGRLDVVPGGIVRYLRQDFVVETCQIVFDDPDEPNPLVTLSASTSTETQASGVDSGEVEVWMVTLDLRGRTNDLVTELIAATDHDRLERFGDVFLLLTLGLTPDQLLEQQTTQRQMKEAGKTLTQDLALSQLSNALEGLTGLDRVTVTSEDLFDPASEKTVKIGQTIKFLDRTLTASVTGSVLTGGPAVVSEVTPTAIQLEWVVIERSDGIPYVDTIALVVSQRDVDDETLGHDRTRQAADLRYRYRFR